MPSDKMVMEDNTFFNHFLYCINNNYEWRIVKTLLKNSSILMVGQLFTKILSVLYLIPLSKISEDIGLLNAAVTIPFGIFVILGTLGLNTMLTSEISKRKENSTKLRSCIVTVFLLMIVMSIISAGILFFFAELITKSLINNQEYIYDLTLATKILSVGVILYSITTFLKAILLAYNNFIIVSSTYIIEQIVKVILILIPSLYLLSAEKGNMGIYAIILAISITLSMTVTLFIYLYKMYKVNLFKVFKEGNIYISKRFIKNIIFSSVLILAGALYSSIFEVIDLTMMENFLVNNEFTQQENILIRGVYFTYSWKIIFIPISMAGSLIAVMLTKISSNIENNRNEFDKLLKISLLFGIISMIFVISLGEYAFNILFSSVDSLGIIIVQSLLIPCYIVRNIIGSYTVANGGKKKSIIYSLIIMIISKIILNVIFLEIFGYLGVILSSVLSIFISIIYLQYQNKKLFILNKENKLEKVSLIIKGLIISGIIIVINKYLTIEFNILVEIIIMTIVSIVLIASIYFNEIKTVLRRKYEK